MKKFTNIGLSAMVAFAMMFATTVVVAQEKVVIADNAEVKEAVEKVALKSANQMAYNLTVEGEGHNSVPEFMIQGGSFEYNGPDGGGASNQWRNTSSWTSITNPLLKLLYLVIRGDNKEMDNAHPQLGLDHFSALY